MKRNIGPLASKKMGKSVFRAEHALALRFSFCFLLYKLLHVELPAKPMILAVFSYGENVRITLCDGLRETG